MLCGVQVMPPAYFPVRSGRVDVLRHSPQPLAGHHGLLAARCLLAATIFHPVNSYQVRG